MKTTIFSLTLIAALTVSCNTSQKENKTDTDNKATEVAQNKEAVSPKTEVPYIVAEKYFVKNTVKDEILTLKLTSKEDFDTYLGMATVMGKDGKPTPIDFSKQYVLVVIEKKSDHQATITPLSLTSQEGVITLHYSINSGDKQSFVSRAVLALVVDNTYDGDIKFGCSE